MVRHGAAGIEGVRLVVEEVRRDAAHEHVACRRHHAVGENVPPLASPRTHEHLVRRHLMAEFAARLQHIAIGQAQSHTRVA